MCGIAGYSVGRPDFKTAIALTLMAEDMESRGSHSWGVMTDALITKGLGRISGGFTMPNKLPKRMAIHTRHATQGKVIAENSHPFVVKGELGEMVGMHNGIISNHFELNHEHKRECVVDSQHIFHHLANGMELNDLEGYGTIVYSLKGSWFLGRFNCGELTVALTEQGIFYASTKTALKFALRFAGLEVVKWLHVEDDAIYQLNSHTLDKTQEVQVNDTIYTWDTFNSAEKGALTNSAEDIEDAEDADVCQANELSKEPIECESCLGTMEGDDDVYWFNKAMICEACYEMEQSWEENKWNLKAMDNETLTEN